MAFATYAEAGEESFQFNTQTLQEYFCMSTEVIIMALVALLFVAFAVVAGMKAIKYVQTSNMMSAISQLATEIQYTFDGKYDDTQGTGSFTAANIYKLVPGFYGMHFTAVAHKSLSLGVG